MAGSSRKRVAGTLLFLIAVVALLTFYFIVFADAQQINGVPGAGNVGAVAAVVAIIMVISLIGLVIVIMASRDDQVRRPATSQAAPDDFFVPPQQTETFTPAFEEVDNDLAVYNIWQLPVAQRAWAAPEDDHTHSFYFPLNVESGVYVNDYIPLSHDRDGPRLKLRTLLAGPPDVQASSFVIPDPMGAPARSERKPEAAKEPATDSSPAWQPEAAPKAAPAKEMPGDHFMRELEGRFHGGETTAQVAVAESPAKEDKDLYYDYRGDIHNVIDVEGIGKVYAAKLDQAGIRTTARLCYETAAEISGKIGAHEKTVASWQAMAQLMKVSGIGPQYAEALARAGIEGIDELKRRSPARIAEQVNEYLDSKAVTITGGTISERRVTGWQAAAKEMRRVRQTVPVE